MRSNLLKKVLSPNIFFTGALLFGLSSVARPTNPVDSAGGKNQVEAPMVFIKAPLSDSQVQQGGELKIKIKIRHEKPADSVCVRFDKDGDGYFDGPEETVCTTNYEDKFFEVSFLGISGKAGKREVLATVSDIQAGASTAKISVKVQGAAKATKLAHTIEPNE